MTRRLVILGAAGDLTARYLLPALARLHEASTLPPGLSILGVARHEWDTAAFRRHIAVQLERHAAHVSRSSRDAVTAALAYRRADITKQRDMAYALGHMTEPVVAYLALPPAVFAPAIAALAAMGLVQGSQVVIEKPFGESLTSAQALNSPIACSKRCGTASTWRESTSSGMKLWRWKGERPTMMQPGLSR
jgi:glucose-6-phosphate 1-dehydrogenase